MKQCAVVLNGNDVIKVSNLKRKYDKIVNNPNMQLLEECDMDMLDEKYDYWKRTVSVGNGEPQEEEILKYKFENPKTGYTITSIYPTLGEYIKDKDDYVRLN